MSYPQFAAAVVRAELPLSKQEVKEIFKKFRVDNSPGETSSSKLPAYVEHGAMVH